MNLVVGATGFLGSEICRQLLAQGQRVRALVRATSDPAKKAALESFGAELVEGDLKDPASRLSHVTAAQVRALIADGTIAGGMVPKVEAALDSLTAGVHKVHIVDASMPHSVLLEIYSDTGVGTEIVP